MTRLLERFSFVHHCWKPNLLSRTAAAYGWKTMGDDCHVCLLCGKPRAGERDDSDNDSDDENYLFQEELESVMIDNKCAFGNL